jgi:hypothetical protein
MRLFSDRSEDYYLLDYVEVLRLVALDDIVFMMKE